MMTDTEPEKIEPKKSLRRSWRSSGPVAKVTARIAAVAAVATVIYAIAACWQLSIMSGQLREIHLENRPMLIPHFAAGFIPVLPNTKLEEPFQFVNVGRMPATNLKVLIVLALHPINELPDFDYNKGHAMEILEAGVIYPNDPKTNLVTGVELDASGKPQTQVISQQMSDLFQKGEAYSVLHGKMTYGGIKGDEQKYSAQFCSIRVIKGLVVPKELADTCTGYNQIDTE